MARSVRLAPRRSVRAFYDAASGQLLIVADGEISVADQVDIEEVLPPSTPLAFRLVAVPRPGVWPRVIRRYRVAEFFRLSGEPDRVRVAGHVEVEHADGIDQVQLAAMPDELVEERSGLTGRLSTGYSASLSFDEAFRDALAGFAPDDGMPDQLLHVRVDEVGGMFGGFAGFHHLYVRLHAPTEGGGGEPITEVAPERMAGGGVIVEVAPERPSSEVIAEIAPEQPYGEGIVEVAPERPIVEIAPERPYGEGIVEVAPERPIVEVAPERPIVEVAPERPDRPGGEGVTEVAPERPERPGAEVIAEIAPERPRPESERSEDQSAGDV